MCWVQGVLRGFQQVVVRGLTFHLFQHWYIARQEAHIAVRSRLLRERLMLRW